MNFVTILLVLGGLMGLTPSVRAAELSVGPGFYSSIESALEASSEGDTVRVKGGVHPGPLTVSKKVHLVGEGLPAIDGHGQGTVVTLGAPGIIFEGFLVRNSGKIMSQDDTGILVTAPDTQVLSNELRDVLFGAYLKHAPGSVLKGNRLYGKGLDLARRGDLIRVWYSDNVRIEDNVTFRGRDAVLWYSKDMVLRGNTFRNGRYGVHFMYCRHALVEDNVFSDNSVGAYLMYSEGLILRANRMQGNRGPSGYGIGFKDMENAKIHDNVVTGNRVGFFLDSSTGGDFQKNLVAYNDRGFELFPSVKQNRFLENNVVDNAEQVTLDQSSLFTVNVWESNYWSDYRGYDADRDGLGDMPYRPMKLYERLTDRFQDLKIFFSSPSVHAIDYAAATFPLFAPTPKFEDPKPRVFFDPFSLRAQKPVFSYAWAAATTVFFVPVMLWIRLSA